MNIKIGFANVSAETYSRLRKTRLLKAPSIYEKLHILKLVNCKLVFAVSGEASRTIAPRYTTNCRFLADRSKCLPPLPVKIDF
ncbi:MAG: hypothetical protein ABI262_24825 [Microcoleus sp.]